MLCVGWQVQVQDVSKHAQVLGRRDDVDLQAAASTCKEIALSQKKCMHPTAS